MQHVLEMNLAGTVPLPSTAWLPTAADTHSANTLIACSAVQCQSCNEIYTVLVSDS